MNQDDRDPNNIKDFNGDDADNEENLNEINDSNKELSVKDSTGYYNENKTSQTKNNLAIRIQNCTYSWGNKTSEEEYQDDEAQPRTLKNINLEIKQGEFIGVIGEVGSGKSSLLHMIMNNMMKIDEEEEKERLKRVALNKKEKKREKNKIKKMSKKLNNKDSKKSVGSKYSKSEYTEIEKLDKSFLENETLRPGGNNHKKSFIDSICENKYSKESDNENDINNNNNNENLNDDKNNTNNFDSDKDFKNDYNEIEAKLPNPQQNSKETSTIESNQDKNTKESKLELEKENFNEKANTKQNLNNKKKNIIQIKGLIAYVSQSAWIQNATLRENILLFKEYNKSKLDKILDICELRTDLKILSGGELTEIGEKGINLSGGQKTRVSLARAAYSNSDIYLLDDPLAALDGNVGKNIFHNFMKEYLKEKTRILVTNNINYLEYLDRIVLLKNGEVSFAGTFEEFRNSDYYVEFANYLKKEKDKEDEVKNNPENKNGKINIKVDSKLEAEDEIEKAFKKKDSMIENIRPKVIKNENENENKESDNKDIVENKIESHLIEKTEIDLDALNTPNKEDKNILITEEEEKHDIKKDEIQYLIQDEDKETGKVKLSVYNDYIRYNGGICVFLIIILIMILWQALKIGGDFWMSIWIKNPVFSNPYYNYAVFAGLAFFSNVFIFLRLYLLVVGTMKMSISLHKEMLDSLTSAPINLYHDVEPKGRILNRLSKDLEYVIYIMFCFGNLLSNLFFVIGVIVLCSYYIYYLMAFLPLLLGVGTMVCLNYMYPSRELTRVEGVTRSKLINIISETLPGISTIIADNKQEEYRSYLNKTLSEINIIEIYFAGINSWFGILLDIQSFIFIFCMMGFVILYPDKFDEVSIGLLLAYSNNLSDRLFSTLSSMSYLENNMVSLERCVAYTKIISEKSIITKEDKEREESENNFLETNNIETNHSECQESIKSSSNNKDNSNSKSNSNINSRNNINLGNSSVTPTNNTNITNLENDILFIPDTWPEKGDLEFINYSVRYRPNTPLVLKNISISIKQGEKIGVVGRTGSGKSTLCLCLFRILEAHKGSILIDNLDISQVPLNHLRSKLTIIPQESAILDGTLRFNIDPLNIVSDDYITNVLKNIGLWELLKQKDVNSEISEDSLSVGERQLICIARAIIRNSKIVVTDEATASIDLVTEEKIQKAFQTYFKSATIITIAHRIKTVVHSDKILVMDKGEVIEFGSPKELLDNTNGVFYSLYNSSVK